MTRSHEPEPGRPIHETGADGALEDARGRDPDGRRSLADARSLRATPTIRRYGSPTTRGSTS